MVMRTLGWLALWSGLSLALTGGARTPPRPEATSLAVAETSGRPAALVATDHHTATLRGRLAWMGEALRQRYGIEHDEQDAKTAVVLESSDGQLVPIVKDSRGRGFWLDERLHGIELELFVRRRAKLPWVQVIRVYAIHGGEKFELDYWCDICAIPMFELKPCECCQGETRLRERAADGSERQRD